MIILVTNPILGIKKKNKYINKLNMVLLDNQSYKKKISFVSTDNEDNKVVINLSVACNHEIPKHTTVMGCLSPTT
jgi:hypothetical protein